MASHGGKLWFALLQGYHATPRFRRLNELEELWWTRALSWCAQHLTDGVLTEREARTLVDFTGWTFEGEEQSWPGARAHLVESGLVEEHPDGLQLHDYLEHNPSRAEVEATRAAKSAAGKKGAERRWKDAEHGSSHGSSYGTTDGKPMAHEHEHAHASHSPTREQASALTTPPAAAKKAAGKDRRGTRLGADWTPSDALRLYAKQKAPHVNVEVESELFVNYWLAVPGDRGVKLDWDATWRGWMLRAETRAAGAAPTAATPAKAQQAEEQRAEWYARRNRWLAARGITPEQWEAKEKAGDVVWMERVRAMQVNDD